YKVVGQLAYRGARGEVAGGAAAESCLARANRACYKDEEVSVRLGEDKVDFGENFNLCLVGRVLMESLVHFLSMKNTLTNLWHPLGGTSITDICEKRDGACLRFLPVKANAGRSRGGVWLGKFIKGRAKKDNATSLWLREEPKEGIKVGGRSNRDQCNLASRNENLKLERSRVGAPANSSSSQEHVETGLDPIWIERRLIFRLERGGRCNLQSFSSSYIYVIVKEEREVSAWRFTEFYGTLVEGLRKESLNLLRWLGRGCDIPWVIMGDFNEIMFSFEKKRREDERGEADECLSGGA
ncbi:hypothetical protein Gohar_026853, partial [Gossypium harknessii]|nr:hypothetical protein [Gossypium harknessii]